VNSRDNFNSSQPLLITPAFRGANLEFFFAYPYFAVYHVLRTQAKERFGVYACI